MKAMTRRSQTAAANRASSSAAKPTITAPVRASDAVASSAVGPNFDDEENVIMSFLIALHESILANTAAAGPAKESKDAVWGLICGRLRNKIGGIERTDEQVSQCHLFTSLTPWEGCPCRERENETERKVVYLMKTAILGECKRFWIVPQKNTLPKP